MLIEENFNFYSFYLMSTHFSPLVIQAGVRLEAGSNYIWATLTTSSVHVLFDNGAPIREIILRFSK